MDKKLEIILAARNQTKQAFQAATRQIEGFAEQSRARFRSLQRSVFSLQSGIVALAGSAGLGALARGFVQTGAKMDKFRISLDTITKGQGEEWFRKLNEWALKMPVNTEKAIQSFTMMRAMGLKPTIKDMTTLVDTTSALGGQSDTLEGIARALGQIKTKGKVSAEELMQLAERGVPAYEILKEKLHLTSEQLSNIGNEAISGDVAVRALLEGMTERFGGQSKKIQETWSGLTESLRSYWVEFQRMVMDSGVMRFLEAGLSMLIKKLDEVKASGKLGEWAQAMGKKVMTGLGWIIKAAALVADAFRGWQMIWEGLKGAFAVFALYINKGIEAILRPLAKLATFMRLDVRHSLVSTLRASREAQEYWNKEIDESAKKLQGLTKGLSVYQRAEKILEKMRAKTKATAKTVRRDVIPAIKDQGKAHRDQEKDVKFMEDLKEKAFRKEMMLLDRAMSEEDKWITKGLANLRKMETGYDHFGETISRIGEETSRDLEQGLSDYFYNAFTGRVESAGDIWKSFTSNLKDRFARMVSDIAADKIMMFFKSGWDGNPGGQGTIERMLGIDVPFLSFARGGEVPGAWNGRRGFAGDTVPAMLTPGEWVVPRDVAKIPAVKTLLQIISGEAGRVQAGKNIPALMSVQGLAGGGEVKNPYLPHYGFFSGGTVITGWEHVEAGEIESRRAQVARAIELYKAGLLPRMWVSPWRRNYDLQGMAAHDIGWYSPKAFKYVSGYQEKSFLHKIMPAIMTTAMTAGTNWLLTPALGAAMAGMLSGVIGGAASGAMSGRGPLGLFGGAIIGGLTGWAMGSMAGEPTQTVKMGGRYVKVPQSAVTDIGGGRLIVSTPSGDVFAEATYFPESMWGMGKQAIMDVWDKIKTVPSNVGRFLSDLPSSTAKLAGSLWKGIKALPANLWDSLKNFDVLGYVSSRLKEILAHFQLVLAGMTGGKLLDKGKIAGTLGISSGKEAPLSFATGTGLEGLPYTGLFYGHRGEIVKSPAESELERSGALPGGPLQITVQIGAEEFEAYIARVSDDVRVRAERRNMGIRRIY